MCASDSPIKAQLIKFIELAGTCITKLTAKTTFQMTHEQHELNIVAMRSVENHARKQLAHQHTQYATEHLSEYSEECSVTPNTCCMRALPTNGTTCQHVNCKSAGRHGELPGAGPSGAVTARKTGLLHELTPQSRSGGEIERCQGLAQTPTSPQASALSIHSLSLPFASFVRALLCCLRCRSSRPMFAHS